MVFFFAKTLYVYIKKTSSSYWFSIVLHGDVGAENLMGYSGIIVCSSKKLLGISKRDFDQLLSKPLCDIITSWFSNGNFKEWKG